VDIWKAVELTAGHPGQLVLRPGVGAGGHCLPEDARYLAWAVRKAAGVAGLVETACAINASQPEHVTDRILAGIRARGIKPTGARLVACGVTYKPNVADTRNSCALDVVARLRQRGADIRVVDPLIDGEGSTRRLTLRLVTEADAVVVLVDHAELNKTLLTHAAYVFDACDALPRAVNVEKL
jgi:UDP-N-acetyl-D-glucosamine dehydrogenase